LGVEGGERKAQRGTEEAAWQAKVCFHKEKKERKPNQSMLARRAEKAWEAAKSQRDRGRGL